MLEQSWLYTCAIPVSVQCANAHLPSIGGDLLPEKIAFILVPTEFGTRVTDIDYSLNLEPAIAVDLVVGEFRPY